MNEPNTQDEIVKPGLQENSRTFVKVLDELDNVFAHIDETLAQTNIDSDRVYTIRLAVEEIFANMVKHNSPGRETVTLSLSLDDSELRVELIDHGVEPFNISDPTSTDMDISAQAGITSGRGIFLIRQMVDSLEYNYIDGDSHVRFSLNLGSTNA